MSPQEKQELAELEEMNALESRYGNGSKQASGSSAGPQPSGKSIPELGGRDVTPGMVSKGWQEAKDDAHDATLGATQGFLMGGGDEAVGGLGALMDKAWGVAHNLGLTDEESVSQANARIKDGAPAGSELSKLPTTMGEMYRDGQQAAKKEFDKSAERSPWLYHGAELGGGLASFALGGQALGAGATALGAGEAAAGLGAAATKAAPAIGDAITAAKALKNGGALAKTAYYGGKIGLGAGKSVLEGIPVGAAAGYLGSDGKSTLIDGTDKDNEQLTGDMVQGMKTGSLWGAGLGALSEAAPLVPKIIKAGKDKIAAEYGPVARMEKAYDLGRSGTPVLGRSGQEAVGKASDEVASGVVGGLKKAGDTLGSELANSTKASNMKFGPDTDPNLTDALQGFDQMITQTPGWLNKGRATQAKALLGKFANGEMTANDAFELRKMMNEAAGKVDPRNGDILNTFSDAQDAIKKSLTDNVDGYRQANDHFAQFRNDIPETLLNKTNQDLGQKYSMSDKKHAIADLYNNLSSTIEGAGKESGAADKPANLIRQLKDQINNYEAARPGEFARLTGMDPAETIKKIEDQANTVGVRRTLLGDHASGSWWRDTPAATAYGGALLAGKAVRGVSKLGQGMYNMGPAQLKGVATDLINQPAFKHLGQALTDAVDSGDIGKKNAVLFSIMQNPNLRGKYQPDQESP